MLADKLNMSVDEAERWIVNLIRNAKLDAKIDSKMGHVMMGTQAISPYEQVIIFSNQKSNLHYSGRIRPTPKRVTNSFALIRGNAAPKKRRSGGEHLATLNPI